MPRPCVHLQHTAKAGRLERRKDATHNFEPELKIEQSPPTLQYMAKSGAVNAVIEVLKKSGVEAVVFDGAVPNPTDKNVRRAEPTQNHLYHSLRRAMQ